MKEKRSCGLLLPVSCLPSPFGIGDLGPGAYRFADFLYATRQHVWQILPLNPTLAAFAIPPIRASSVFAVNPLLISPERLVADGLLTETDLTDAPAFSPERVRLRSGGALQDAPAAAGVRTVPAQGAGGGVCRFCGDNAPWLDDFAHFSAFRAISTMPNGAGGPGLSATGSGGPCTGWPPNSPWRSNGPSSCNLWPPPSGTA